MIFLINLIIKEDVFIYCNPIFDLIKARILENEQGKSDSLAQTDIFTKAKYKNISFETSDNNETHAWLVTPPDMNDQTKIVLVLHGNNDNRQTFCKNYEIENVVVANNAALLIVDYRDFGDSKGEFDRHTVVYDVSACLSFLKAELDTNDVDVVAISLGSGILFEYISYCTSDEKKKEHCILDKPYSKDEAKKSQSLEKLKAFMSKNEEIKFKAEEKETATIQRVSLISPIKSIYESVKNMIYLNSFPNILKGLIDKFILTKFAFDNTKKVKLMPKENLKAFHGTKDELIPIDQIEEMLEQDENTVIKLEGEDHASAIKSESSWKQVFDFFK